MWYRSVRFWLFVAVAIVAIILLLLFRDAQQQPPTGSQPSQEAQGQVLVIPGYGGNQAQLKSLVESLQAAGLTASVVDIGNGEGDLREYALQVERQANELVAKGEPAPDLVGYSAGGVIARIAAVEDAGEFRKVATIGTPHLGTATADFGAAFGQCPQACQQLRPRSSLITRLAGPTDPNSWLSVWSDTDEVIQPATSSEISGATMFRVQQACPGTVSHGNLPADPTAKAAVVDFLTGAALPTACAIAPR